MKVIFLKFLLILVSSACLGLVVAAGILYLKEEAKENEGGNSEPAKVLKVKVEEAQFAETFTKKRFYSGVIKSRREADLAFSIGGVVKGISFEQGESVKEGDLLAVLEDGPPTNKELTAPIDGEIASISITEGTTVRPNMPVMKIIQRDQMKVSLGIPVSEATELNKDQTYNFLVDGKSHEGELSTVQLEVNPRTRTRTAVFRFDRETSLKLLPGEAAQLELQLEQASSGYWLPVSALTREIRGLWSAFVVENGREGTGRISRRYLDVIHFDGDRALVKGALEKGDLVVSEGTFRVVPGQWVKTEVGSPPG